MRKRGRAAEQVVEIEQAKRSKAADVETQWSVKGEPQDEDEEEEREEDDHVNYNYNYNQEEGEEDGDENDVHDESIVKIDSNVFSCGLCRKPLRPPIFQCANGHVTCSPCRAKLPAGTCHACPFPANASRCLLLERALESIRTPCPYRRFGCRETVTHARRPAHEDACPYAPCTCPASGCAFRGAPGALDGHVRSSHGSAVRDFHYRRSFRVSIRRDEPFQILRGKDGRLFLLLNGRDAAAPGSSLSVACIRPSPAAWDLEYVLVVGEGKRSSLQLRACPTNIREWKGVYPGKDYLFVPDDRTQRRGSSGIINVDIRIRRIKTCLLD